MLSRYEFFRRVFDQMVVLSNCELSDNSKSCRAGIRLVGFVKSNLRVIYISWEIILKDCETLWVILERSDGDFVYADNLGISNEGWLAFGFPCGKPSKML